MKRQVTIVTRMLRSSDKVAMVVALSILLLGGLMILATAAPAAETPALPAVVTTDAAEGQAPFRARVLDQLRDWRVKMDAFEKRAKARGELHADAAGAQLRAAWSKTETEGGKVQVATAQEWDRVKASYQSAWHDLAVAWTKVRR